MAPWVDRIFVCEPLCFILRLGWLHVPSAQRVVSRGAPAELPTEQPQHQGNRRRVVFWGFSEFTQFTANYRLLILLSYSTYTNSTVHQWWYFCNNSEFEVLFLSSNQTIVCLCEPLSCYIHMKLACWANVWPLSLSLNTVYSICYTSIILTEIKNCCCRPLLCSGELHGSKWFLIYAVRRSLSSIDEVAL